MITISKLNHIFYYQGASSFALSGLPSDVKNKIDAIFTISSGGTSLQSWRPTGLSGFSSLVNGQGYYIVSKTSGFAPYDINITASHEQEQNSTVSKINVFLTYQGCSIFSLSDLSSDVKAKIDAIFTVSDSGSSLLSWRPVGISGFASLKPNQNYYIVSKVSGFSSYNLGLPSRCTSSSSSSEAPPQSSSSSATSSSSSATSSSSSATSSSSSATSSSSSATSSSSSATSSSSSADLYYCVEFKITSSSSSATSSSSSATSSSSSATSSSSSATSSSSSATSSSSSATSSSSSATSSSSSATSSSSSATSSSSSAAPTSSSSSSHEFCEYNGVLFPKITITKQPLLVEDATTIISNQLFKIGDGCKGDIIHQSFTVNATFTPDVPENRKVYAWIYTDPTVNTTGLSSGWKTTPSGVNVIPSGTGGGYGWWAGGQTLNIEVDTNIFCPGTNISGQLRLDVAVGYLADNGLVYSADETCNLNASILAGTDQYFAVDCGSIECSSSSSATSSSSSGEVPPQASSSSATSSSSSTEEEDLYVCVEDIEDDSSSSSGETPPQSSSSSQDSSSSSETPPQSSSSSQGSSSSSETPPQSSSSSQGSSSSSETPPQSSSSSQGSSSSSKTLYVCVEDIDVKTIFVRIE